MQKHGLLISYLKTKHTDGASVNNLILVSLKMLSTLSSNEDWLIRWPLRSWNMNFLILHKFMSIIRLRELF